MMGLVLAWALSACDAGQVEGLEEGRRAAACELLAQPIEPLAERPSLEDIYSRPGFERARRRDAGAMQTLFAQLMHRLRGLFETRGAESFSNVTRVVVLAAALLLAVGIALRLRRRKPARAEARGATRSAPLFDAPGEHLTRARALVGSSPREALREALLALLSALERARLARPDRVKTNRELVTELPERGATPALTARVAELVAQFDGAYYSLEPVPPELASEFLARVEPLVAEVA